jgi:hypothetical protein
MVTRYLVRAQDCLAIDAQRISDAGGRLLAVGRIEDDGTVTVDVDVQDLAAGRRLGAMFAESHDGMPAAAPLFPHGPGIPGNR